MLYKIARILNRKTILIMLVIFIFLLAFVIIKYGTVIFGNLGNIAAIFGIISPIFLLSICNPKMYLIFVYIKALFFGEKTLWNLSVNYYGKINEDSFKKVKSELNCISKHCNIHIDKDNIYKITLDGINITITLRKNDYEEDDFDKLHFQITDFRAPYEDTLQLLEYDIMPYLRKIDSCIKPERSDYELCINFINGNPWAKAISKGIDYNRVKTMDFIINIGNDKSNGIMSLGKEYIRVSCSELNLLYSLIKKHLIPSL